jgi:hypothetical protein
MALVNIKSDLENYAPQYFIDSLCSWWMLNTREEVRMFCHGAYMIIPIDEQEAADDLLFLRKIMDVGL